MALILNSGTIFGVPIKLTFSEILIGGMSSNGFTVLLTNFPKYKPLIHLKIRSGFVSGNVPVGIQTNMKIRCVTLETGRYWGSILDVILETQQETLEVLTITTSSQFLEDITGLTCLNVFQRLEKMKTFRSLTLTGDGPWPIVHNTFENRVKKRNMIMTAMLGGVRNYDHYTQIHLKILDLCGCYLSGHLTVGVATERLTHDSGSFSSFVSAIGRLRTTRFLELPLEHITIPAVHEIISSLCLQECSVSRIVEFETMEDLDDPLPVGDNHADAHNLLWRLSQGDVMEKLLWVLAKGPEGNPGCIPATIYKLLQKNRNDRGHLMFGFLFIKACANQQILFDQRNTGITKRSVMPGAQHSLPKRHVASAGS
jgi:hypothetical protein